MRVAKAAEAARLELGRRLSARVIERALAMHHEGRAPDCTAPAFFKLSSSSASSVDGDEVMTPTPTPTPPLPLPLWPNRLPKPSPQPDLPFSSQVYRSPSSSLPPDGDEEEPVAALPAAGADAGGGGCCSTALASADAGSRRDETPSLETARAALERAGEEVCTSGVDHEFIQMPTQAHKLGSSILPPPHPHPHPAIGRCTSWRAPSQLCACRCTSYATRCSNSTAAQASMRSRRDLM